MSRKFSKWILFALAIAWCTAFRSAAAQEPSQALENTQQFINPTTIVVAQFDMQRLKLPAETQQAIAEKSTAQPLLAWLSSMRTALTPMLDGQISVMVDMPFTASQVPVRIIAKKPAGADLKKLNEALAACRCGPAIERGDYLMTAFAGTLADSEKLMIDDKILSGDRERLAAAWSTVQNMPASIMVIPPAYLWSTMEDLMPRLPVSWGGSSVTTITEGIQWATVGIDPAQQRLQVIVQSKSNTAAEKLNAELPKLVDVLRAMPPLVKFSAAFDSLKFDPPVVKDTRIQTQIANWKDANSMSASGLQLLSAIVDPLSLREKQQRFRKLALAVHNYASAFKALPPAKNARREDGSSQLSWRVHILPFLGEQKLYAEFKLNEAWDSEHNRQLIDKMPDVFASHLVPAFTPAIPRGYTTFVAPVGEGTVFGSKTPVEFGHVKDGTSNTIFFVEVKPERAVPWTAPLDYEFQPADPAAGLAIGSDGRFLCVLGDGFVTTLPGNLPATTFVHLFQMNDGQAIELP